MKKSKKNTKKHRFVINRYIAIVAFFAFSIALALTTRVAFANSKTVVLPGDMATSFAEVVENPTSWFFYNDENDTIDNALGTFINGPATPPEGKGGVQISVSGTQRRNLATYQFSGKKLADITTLAFSTYNPTVGNNGSVNRSAYLNFNVDFDGSDSWQRRLVFVPSDNGSVVQDSWQRWDAIGGGNALWRHSGATWPVTGEPGSTTKTWNQILTDYPNVRVRVTDSWLGLRVGEPYASGYTENIDKFEFSTATDSLVFDFEPSIAPPTSKAECKKKGWKIFNNPSFENRKECVQYVWDHIEPISGRPTAKDQCKKGGWRAFIDYSFENQKECTQFVKNYVEPRDGHPTTKAECKEKGWRAYSDPSFESKKKCLKFVKNNLEHHNDDEDDYGEHHDDDHKDYEKHEDEDEHEDDDDE